MPSIRSSREAKRGCGYRKPGGMYLVAGKPSVSCYRLPLPLCRCPVCDAGIKFARGWTWISPRRLFADVPCQYPAEHGGSIAPLPCQRCLLGELPERAGLIWIGEKFYPTPADFMREASTRGLSRRIQAVPRKFQLGQDIVLLAHLRCIPKPLTLHGEEAKLEYDPGVFTAFKPEAIEYVITGKETEEELERLEQRGLSLVDVIPC